MASMGMSAECEDACADELDELEGMMMEESSGCDMMMAAAPMLDVKEDLACYMAKSSIATVSKKRESRRDKE